MKSLFRLLLLSVFLAAVNGYLNASELMNNSDKTKSKRFEVSTYYGRSAKEIDFGSYGEYDFVQDFRKLHVMVNVWNGLYAYAKFGFVNLELSRGSNNIEMQEDFLEDSFGGGLQWTLPANNLDLPVSIDVGITQWSGQLDVLNGKTMLEQDIDVTEIQLSVFVTKKIYNFVSYAGLKYITTDFTWKRNNDTNFQSTTYKEIEGDHSGVSPFVGINYPIFSRFSLLVEGSFLAETIVSAGLQASF